jgi:prepilin-type processing-associated H-X9-DG protein
MVVLRERIARQAPDGTWSRIYLFADGSVQIATSYDGNFDAWEKANTYSTPPNQ